MEKKIIVSSSTAKMVPTMNHALRRLVCTSRGDLLVWPSPWYLVQLILSGIFYFFGALLQLVSQAMFASLVLAHNGAPSFLSEFLCILLNSNHFNTIHQQGQTMVKIHYKFYFTMAVNLE